MDRHEAFDLLNQYTKNQNLIKHGLAVEAVMIFYAKKLGQDENVWGITGLLHDFDYEMYPNAKDHPLKGSVILKNCGYPENIITGQPVAFNGNTYITKVPSAKEGKTDICSVNYEYKYTYINDKNYSLTYCLDKDVDIVPSGFHTASPKGIF